MYWILKRALLGPIVRWFTRPRVVGALPSGPVVLAANHLTEIDSLVLCAALPRRLTFVAKSEYFARGGAGAWLYGKLCRMTGQIPIARDSGERADGALLAARGILERGGVWAIYPEGTRSIDGRLWRGHTGVMRVALQGPHPVVPVGIIGSRSINPPGAQRWRRGRVEIRIGSPLDLSPWTGSPTSPNAWRSATDALMGALQDLTGQAYVDRYATPAERARRDGNDAPREP